MTEHKEYPIKITHACGHTTLLYRSINDNGMREWVAGQENKTCGNLACKPS